MSTPRYFHFYDMPDFDVRFGTDLAFTRRCEVASVPLYKLLATEVKFLRQVPGDCLDASIWDLCYCAGVVVDSIPFDGWTVEASCEREAPQFFKLAKRFIEYNVTSQNVRSSLEALIAYVSNGVATELMEVAS